MLAPTLFSPLMLLPFVAAPATIKIIVIGTGRRCDDNDAKNSKSRYYRRGRSHGGPQVSVMVPSQAQRFSNQIAAASRQHSAVIVMRGKGAAPRQYGGQDIRRAPDQAAKLPLT
jgi:hypothetical protein